MTAAPALRPGVDLIEIERLERALERRPRLAERLFSEGELIYANARGRPARHLAARFAAKEAAFKAIGTGLSGGVGWKQAEVI
ncbi:MAG: 4'-phosphopantetheinyl transferase superfamily protein, partial [Solirubrobacterales bacterium]